MSDSKQYSFGDVARKFTSSPGQLALAAAACAILAAVTPVISLSGSFMGIASGSTSVSGEAAAGTFAWIAVAAFALAAASRYLVQLKPYSSILDVAAWALLAVAVVWAFIGGPAVSELNQAKQLLGGLSGLGGPPGGRASPFGGPSISRPAVSMSVVPSIGIVFLLLAPAALFFARKAQGRTSS